MTHARYKRIGLTGGIGSGKTTAADRFASLGVPVVGADAISRRSLKKDGACYGRVVETFGAGILRNDGTIDRKALAAIIFSDENKRRLLNDIVHPYVLKEMFEQANGLCDDSRCKLVLFDVPLLFESGMDREMDANVLVACDEETRVRRIMARDGTTREAAEARIRSQMPEEEKRARADYVLDNNFTPAHLNEQVKALYKKLTESAYAADAE
jgi:dephospho-CoA kinase